MPRTSYLSHILWIFTSINQWNCCLSWGCPTSKVNQGRQICLMIHHSKKKFIKSGATDLTTASLSDRSSIPNCGCKSRVLICIYQYDSIHAPCLKGDRRLHNSQSSPQNAGMDNLQQSTPQAAFGYHYRITE